MRKIFNTLALLCALAAIVTVSAADYVEEEGVLVLGDTDLATAIGEFEYILVEFYAPWCGHCKTLAPEYAKAATMLKEEGSNARLAKVDATENPKVAGQYGVQGYPTLKFFIKGEPIEYEGGRTDKEIVNWIRRKTQPSIIEADSAQHLNEKVASNDVVLVFFGGKDHEAFTAFESVSKKFDSVNFIYISNAEIRAEHNVPEGTNFVLFTKFDQGRNQLTGAVDVASLTNFVNEHKDPLVLPFDQPAAQKIFGGSIPTIFLIYKTDEAGKKVEATFNQAAQKLKGKIQFSISDINDGGLGPRLAEFVGVTESESPAIRLVVPLQSAAPKKFVFDREVTVENLVQFYEEYSTGKLSVFRKSEPLPEKNDEPVKVIVGKNFNDIVMDPTKDVFVEFYAPWCGHCKQLIPIWDDLAASLSSISNLVIAKMDATANEVESVEVSGYPAIKFFPANGKAAPIDYDGERTKQGFIDWLKEKITVEHPPAAFTRDEL